MSGPARTSLEDKFWENKTLDEMSGKEWELLCDGCGRCCLNKLEDKETGIIYHTNVSCRFLDISECKCICYDVRKRYATGCHILTPEKIRTINWLPSTCAYRLLNEGKSLPPWHHLLTGDHDMVHDAGISVRNIAISESKVDMDNLEAYIIDGDL